MALNNPWKQSFDLDENGNPIAPADYDAATASEVDRAPAGMPLMLSRKGRANYNASANAVAMPKQAPAPIPATPMATAAAPTTPMSPLLPGMQSLKSDVGYTPGMGNQLQEKAQLTEGQKQDLQHTLFQSPERARLNMQQAMGMYAQPLRDENGEIVKDSDGNIVYDPSNTVADSSHPYQQQLAALNSAHALLKQRLQFAPNQTDLTPLMALADAWSPRGDKSNLVESYKPHTYDQASQSAMQMMDELQKRRVDMGKEAQSGANNMQAGRQSTALTMQMLQSQMAGMGMGRPFNPITASNDWNNQVKAAFQKDDADADNMNQLLSEVKSGNPIDDARISIIRASADAHGRPNMAEVNNEAGSKALVAKAAQAWQFLTTGQLTNENRSMILQSLHTIAAYRQAVRDLQARRFSQMGSAQYGQNPNQIAANLSPSYVKRYNTSIGAPEPAKAAAPEAPATPSAGPSIMDMIRQTLQENKGK